MVGFIGINLVGPLAKMWLGYSDIIKDIYEEALASNHFVDGMSNEFSVITGLLQWSALSPCLFILVIDELTRKL